MIQRLPIFLWGLFAVILLVVVFEILLLFFPAPNYDKLEWSQQQAVQVCERDFLAAESIPVIKRELIKFHVTKYGFLEFDIEMLFTFETGLSKRAFCHVWHNRNMLDSDNLNTGWFVQLK